LIVSNIFCVLATVEFDDQAMFPTNKVDNVTTYGFLSFELQAQEAMRP